MACVKGFPPENIRLPKRMDNGFSAPVYKYGPFSS